MIRTLQKWFWSTALPEWMCELLGTMILLFAGFTAIGIAFAAYTGGPTGIGAYVRYACMGAVFGGAGALVAYLPIGRLSGAHLNPAVSIAFWVTGHVSWKNLIGYIAFQCLGAVCAMFLWIGLFGSDARAVHDALTRPGLQIPPLLACFIEMVLTASLVGIILYCVSSEKRARWTPVAVWCLVPLLVCVGAPLTGASMNPARSFGPALISGVWSSFWVYCAGPACGAAAVAGCARLTGWHLRILTAKLFHDIHYRSIHRSLLAQDIHEIVDLINN